MKYIFAVLLLSINYVSYCQTSTITRRSDSYFGLHFDFHAQASDKSIGKTITAANIDSVLDIIKPDFIQVDTKGHVGYASYPTKVGITAPGLINDPLVLIRQETAKKGVGLYAHFSGVWDAQAIKNHPQWARININGKPDTMANSMFSDYEETYFIPQIEELIKNYHIDGVWVDGDNWTIQPDLSPLAIKAYSEKTGVFLSNSPTRLQGLGRLSLVNFTRNQYQEYLEKWVSQLHAYNPSFQVASNWAFSGYMPGPITADVDFLSGDLSDPNPLDQAIFESRCLSSYGKTWDLMPWIRYKIGGNIIVKNNLQLEQEAASILSQGGAVQIYVPQNRDASLPTNNLNLLKQIADFCKSRKNYCFKTVAVPQVALLFSVAGWDSDVNSNYVFNESKPNEITLRKMLNKLLDDQYSVQVLQEQQLTPIINSFPFMVISDWKYLSPDFVKTVKSYVSKGGKLLVMSNSANYFNDVLGNPSTIVSGSSIRTVVYGRGKIGVINGLENENINTDISNFFDDPMVKIKGSHDIQLSLRKKDTDLLLQIVNVSQAPSVIQRAGFYANFSNTKSLSISVALSNKPRVIKLQPENKSIDFKYNGSEAMFTIPQGIKIYSIIQIEN